VLNGVGFRKKWYMTQKKSFLFASVIGILAGGVRLASADTIDVTDFDGGALDNVGGNGHYFYSVTLDGSADVKAGDGFVIFDFPGYIPGSAQFIGGFSPSVVDLGSFTLTDQALVGTSLPGYSASGNQANFPTSSGSESANDNPGIPNLTFTYSGTTYSAAANGNISTSVELEVNSVDTQTGTTVVAAVGVDNSGSNQSFSASLNAVEAPNPPLGGGNGVPLPVSSIGGGLLFGLFAVGRVWKAKRLDA